MLTRPVNKILILSCIIGVVLSACGGGAVQTAPIEVSVEESFTPAATSTLANTPTAPATATSTSTPPPTVTFTPNVTATLLPEITPAVEGKGNVAGLVLWNGKPVPKAAVWLCEEFTNSCDGRYQYRTNSDENGYFIFPNVTPGSYIIAANSFNSSWFIFYSGSSAQVKQKVAAGENLILEPLHIWKLDLTPTEPRYDKVMAEAQPILKWNAYPEAVYYEVSILDINYTPIITEEKTESAEFIPPNPLVSCRYYWYVDAFNAEGSKIASSISKLMQFQVIDVPGTC